MIEMDNLLIDLVARVKYYFLKWVINVIKTHYKEKYFAVITVYLPLL